jgi:3-oxoacyl-[acyl-carrier protein] reductase
MSNKHIIITGASRGIGAETADHLLSSGNIVTIISRSEEKLKEIQARHPGSVHCLALDITDKNTGNLIGNHLEESNLSLDGFVHNAGLLINKPFAELTDDDWNKQMQVNFLAPARITQILLPHFTKPSHIVFISSMGGYQGSSKFPGLSGYSASKGALSILSECLAEELKGNEIYCNSLCLGAVQTEMLESAFPGFNAPVQPAQMGKFISDFVLSGHSFFNGQILPVTLGNPG